jgi:phosphoribosylformimino-5-aminoimidazole carboxamide ribonucleotide (ProFAR) isomerase
MLGQANDYIEKGVYGINLLGYRYEGNATVLNKNIAENIDAPLCLAGSVNSYERLAEVKEISPWGFTIGSAFFEKSFGEAFDEQIINVLEYIKK